ncbi:MAG: TetR/AcrR family transcriptional regulator [Microthrixaceae bacterium]
MQPTTAHHGDPRERETRDRLVRAAVEVFGEQGYAGTRVADIARRAGYTTGALYTHFESRADLLAQAIAAENGRRLARLTEDLAPSPGPSRTAAEIAATLMGVLATEFTDSDQLLLDGLAASRRDPRVREVLGESLRRLGERLEERMASHPAPDPSAVRDAPGALAYLGLLALLGAVSVRAAGLGDLAPADLEPLVADVLVVFGVDPDTSGGTGPPGPAAPGAAGTPVGAGGAASVSP